MEAEIIELRGDIESLEQRIVSLEEAVNSLLDILYDFLGLPEDANKEILKIQNNFNR